MIRVEANALDTPPKMMARNSVWMRTHTTKSQCPLNTNAHPTHLPVHCSHHRHNLLHRPLPLYRFKTHCLQSPRSQLFSFVEVVGEVRLHVILSTPLLQVDDRIPKGPPPPHSGKNSSIGPLHINTGTVGPNVDDRFSEGRGGGAI